MKEENVFLAFGTISSKVEFVKLMDALNMKRKFVILVLKTITGLKMEDVLSKIVMIGLTINV